ncbi:MAG: hypothetical protein D6701_13910 [Gemmatimonadetes bacterium]|nr:MAG: hypothetical protein D6701_13910 [Gemmatimonadota bacterium]
MGPAFERGGAARCAPPLDNGQRKEDGLMRNSRVPRRRPTALACIAIAAAAISAANAAPVAAAQTDGEPGATRQPTLVVLMAVDQLRHDMLERYDDLYSGGLRRLLDRGRVFTRATHDHAMTATAPGHTTLATGVYPTRHGIVGNSWFEIRDGQRDNVYSMRDRDAPIVAFPDLEGRSPKNVTRDGIAQWIREAEPRARVVSVSRKDRAAIGLSARARGEVFWLIPQGGVFSTSTFYHDTLPGWVQRFNADDMPRLYADVEWESLVPPVLAGRSRPDTASAEGDGTHTYFTHRAADEARDTTEAALNLWRAGTPAPDRATLAFAERAVETLGLGQQGHLDFLAVSLSQTDIIGHGYGPFSREQLDNLLRLDRELGAFFAFLDRTVGPDGWTLAFSADHGVLPVPEYLDPPGGRIGPAFGQRLGALVREVMASGLEGDELAKALAERLVADPDIEAAYTFAELENEPADSFAVLYAHSHSRTRFTGQLGPLGVDLRLRPNLIGGPRGTTHGSPYLYDRWVPVIFYGPGVEPGRTDERVSTVDVAPTLAHLVGVPAPDDLDGRVIVH